MSNTIKNHIHWITQSSILLFAFCCGALLPLAFSPFHIIILAFLCPAALLWIWLKANPWQTFWRGWFFSLGLFSVGVSWVYISLKVYGQANFVLATALTVAMIMVLSLFLAIPGYLFSRFFSAPTNSKILLVFPSVWVFAEWLRTWLLSGFPWLFLGNTQIYSPLSGYAPIFGVFGVSWLVTFISGILVMIVLKRKQLGKVFILILSVIFIGILGHTLSNHAWTYPAGKPISVSLVQGNIPQELKWQANQAQASLSEYQAMTLPLKPNRIIVWPEAAITFWPNQITDTLQNITQTLKTRHSTLITGIPWYEKGRAYNAVIALGNGNGVYRKRHLVPFGEYMPLRGILLWLKNYIEIPMSDFDAGAFHQPFITANGISIANFICYEIAYPTLVANTVENSQLLITVSDDSWFGRSLAPAQHIEIAQMRALETGRYLLMSTNDAVTAIIGPKGKILHFAPPYEAYVLQGEIEPMQGNTPWMSMGMYPIFILWIVAVIVGLKNVTGQPPHPRRHE